MKKLLILIVSIMSVIVTGCSSNWMPSSGNWLPGVYKIDIQQGNIVTQEDINRVKPGMTQRQVRFLLGTPLVTDGFHKDRWDYLYTFRPGGKKTQKQQVTLYFEDNKVARIEGDIYPQPVDDQIASVDKQTIVTINPKPQKKSWFDKIIGTIGFDDEDE
jgi:outer membrane protein assembly factor BamE